MDAEERLQLIGFLAGDHPWAALVVIGRTLLDHYYPENIFTGASGDPGPEYVVAMRRLLKEFEVQHPSSP